MSHFGRWLTGITIVLVVLILIIFLLPTIYRSMQTHDSASTYEQLADQHNTDKAAGEQQIADDNGELTADKIRPNSQSDTEAQIPEYDEDAAILRISDEDAEKVLLSRTNENWKAIEDGPEQPNLQPNTKLDDEAFNPVNLEIPKPGHHGASFVVLPTIATTTNTARGTSKHRKYKIKAAAVSSSISVTTTEAPDSPDDILDPGVILDSSTTDEPLSSNTVLNLVENAMQTFPKTSNSGRNTSMSLTLEGPESEEDMAGNLDAFPNSLTPADKPKTSDTVPKWNEFDLHHVKIQESAEQTEKYGSFRKTSNQNLSDSRRPELQIIPEKSASLDVYEGTKSSASKLMYIKTAGKITFLSFKTDSPASKSTSSTTTTTPSTTTTQSTATTTPSTTAATTTTTPITTSSPTTTMPSAAAVSDSGSDLISDIGGHVVEAVQFDKDIKNFKTVKNLTSNVATTTKVGTIMAPIKITARFLKQTTRYYGPEARVWLKPSLASKHKLETSKSSPPPPPTTTPPSTTAPPPLQPSTTRTTATTTTTATTPTIAITTRRDPWLSQEVITAYDDGSESEAEAGQNDDGTEEEDDEDDDYDDIFIFRRPVITTTSTTPTTTTKVTPPPHPHRHPHHHQQYEQYDKRSPVIVTALFDIGRGKWPKYTRTYEQYMSYLEHLLKLRNRLVIYTDSRGADFVRQKRSIHNTQIFEMSMRDLPLHRYREEMEGIIRREQKDWRFDPKTRDHPEANSADYDIIVNSKPYFLYNATQSSRFRTSDPVFAWIDAGYGHGRKGIIPENCHWRPQIPRSLITIVKMTPAHDKVSKYSVTDLYRVDWTVVSGGFIAGDSYTINRFYRFFHKTFMELLDSGRIDDDQTVLTLTLKNYASLFHPVSGNGDWYAVFRLFPCR